MPRARLRERTLCHYCKVRPGITTDHIVPRAFGGPDAMWNYVSCCEPCNLAKAASWPTCPCDYCRTAVYRFLSDPGRREKALSRLAAQTGEMTDGIDAMAIRIRRLRSFRKKLNNLYLEIANYQEDDPLVEDLFISLDGPAQGDRYTGPAGKGW